jgi:hypothetical protein
LVSASMNGDLTMMSWILILDLDVLTIDTVCGALVVPTVTSPKSSPTRADELAAALLAPARISKSSDCARAGRTKAARINSSEKVRATIVRGTVLEPATCAPMWRNDSPFGRGRDGALTSRLSPSCCLACRCVICQSTDLPNALISNIGREAGIAPEKVSPECLILANPT